MKKSKYDNKYYELFFDEKSKFYGDLGLLILARDQKKTDDLRTKIMKEYEKDREQNLSL